MNSKEYISSGILESYVLGAATPEERKEVEKMAALYPEIKSELEEIEKVMNTYVTEHSIEPPSYLKEKIFTKITNETNNTPITENRVHTLNREPQRDVSHYSYWAIAASLLLLLSVVGNVYVTMQSGKLKKSLAAVNKTTTNLNDSLQSLTVNYKQAMNDMAILKDPMYKIVELKGMKAAPEAKAMVCWCPIDKKVYVEIEKLPMPPQGMQYQLWAFVDGKPVSEGMLTMGNGLHRMSDVDNAQAFAVTLEKQGGSPTPKGEIYVMGNI